MPLCLMNLPPPASCFPGTPCGRRGAVGVHIRGDFTRVSAANNAIKFMTDGILLQEIKKDFLLRKCVWSPALQKS